ncbi:MAG: thioredoxin-dependent thiol peroxidase [Acaryochloridaceae cyanobacterium SU_2_1]|nr:thioredoxin-dependent thiol peroxidase [Acaryochloridaceae cyanobacterium SU_2_1]NJM95525.1 thioredoxin-dependent thiol peroxidase [Acaryochloridaceae cyanobacterium CSU_5_19]
MAIELGDRAPNFTLFDSQAKAVQLSDFLGQWVLLYFYPRDNTPGCTQEAQGFRDLKTEYDQLQTVIIGVSGDDAKSHQKFIHKHDLPFLLLTDPDTAVATAYGSYGPKKFMGKTYEGIYRHSFLINPEGAMAKIYRKVKPADHAAQVLVDLASLQAPNS